MGKLRNILTNEQIAKVRAPVEDAYWLPSKAFTSQEFFNLERDAIFSKTWMSVGFEADVPQCGDAMPLKVLGGIPIVMVRDEKGELRVFHNVCPNDGCIAIWSKETCLSRIVGQYHGWIWNLDGTVHDATKYDGSHRVQKPAHHNGDLKQVRHAVWQGTVFVNLSGDAQPFEDYIAPVNKLYEEIDLTNLHPGTTLDGSEEIVDRFTFKSNWKSTYENFAINIYHEGHVHEDYKAAANVPRVTYEGERKFEEVDTDGYHGLKFDETEADIAYGLARTPKIPRKDGKPHDWNTIMTLYPNTNISLFPNFLLITVLTPHAPDRTGYDSIILYPEDVASDPKYYAQRQVILDRDWAHARNEDAVVCAKVQEGRASPVSDQLFFSPFWEGLSHGFCNRILDDIEAQE